MDYLYIMIRRFLVLIALGSAGLSFAAELCDGADGYGANVPIVSISSYYEQSAGGDLGSLADWDGASLPSDPSDLDGRRYTAQNIGTSYPVYFVNTNDPDLSSATSYANLPTAASSNTAIGLEIDYGVHLGSNCTITINSITAVFDNSNVQASVAGLPIGSPIIMDPDGSVTAGAIQFELELFDPSGSGTTDGGFAMTDLIVDVTVICDGNEIDPCTGLVPEPSSALLGSLFGALYLLRRRRA